METILVTGCSGFIGYHASKALLNKNYKVIGIDNLSNYYDRKLKEDRQSLLEKYQNFTIINEDIASKDLLNNIFKKFKPNYVIHLAAQAGVRYSIEEPETYLNSNIIGTFKLLEAIKNYPPNHTLIASTSSIYGANKKLPFKETDKSDHQVSFYAATKKSTEAMAHSYSHLFNLPITIFRFFTVYGPWGRPDMALFKFTKAILENKEIDVYNYGSMKRDFTYIDDLIRSITSLIDIIPDMNSSLDISPVAPYRIINIGNSQSVKLDDFITALEKKLKKSAKRKLLPMQQGDVVETWANSDLLYSLTNYKPNTSIDKGVGLFVDWYNEYYLKYKKTL